MKDINPIRLIEGYGNFIEGDGIAVEGVGLGIDLNPVSI